MHRWGSLLACVAARACASSLLERRWQPGSDGEAPPAADVLGDFTKAQGASDVALDVGSAGSDLIVFFLFLHSEKKKKPIP